MERQKKSKLMIIVTYSDKAYLFRREGRTKHVYLAKLSDVDLISQKLGIPKNETLDLLLQLVKERRKRTTKRDIKDLMELILFDPELYFGSQ